MKKLILTLALGLTSAYASNTGHIHFQADSTWVNPVTNKSLCFDGEEFHASVITCVQTRMARGGEECSRYGKTVISQPARSTRKVCLEERGESGNCVQYGTVDYVQSPTRRVEFYGDRGGVIRTEMITVPACN